MKKLLVMNKFLRVPLSSTDDDKVRFQSPCLDQLVKAAARLVHVGNARGRDKAE